MPIFPSIKNTTFFFFLSHLCRRKQWVQKNHFLDILVTWWMALPFELCIILLLMKLSAKINIKIKDCPTCWTLYVFGLLFRKKQTYQCGYKNHQRRSDESVINLINICHRAIALISVLTNITAVNLQLTTECFLMRTGVNQVRHNPWRAQANPSKNWDLNDAFK